jgi:hypothetical protein
LGGKATVLFERVKWFSIYANRQGAKSAKRVLWGLLSLLALPHTRDLKGTRAEGNELSPPGRDKGENGRLGTVEVAEASYESSADYETATMEELAQYGAVCPPK